MSTDEKKYLERIEAKLDKLLGIQKSKPKSAWIPTGLFMQQTGLSKEQVRRMRNETHPELFKAKKDGVARYLVNWTGYQSIYNQ